MHKNNDPHFCPSVPLSSSMSSLSVWSDLLVRISRRAGGLETISGMMASKLVPGIQKHGTWAGNPREVSSASPETSLTWCLSQLSKPGRAAAEDHKPGTAGPDTSGHRQLDKRVKAGQWRALVAIRTQHIKGGSSGIARFRGQGGLRTLLDLLKHPECSRKTLDLALSILANCCTERQTRVEVRQKGVGQIRAASHLHWLNMNVWYEKLDSGDLHYDI